MAPKWLKSLLPGRPKQSYAVREAEADRERERRRQELRSFKHRDELLDITRPPYNILPRVRDLEHPLTAPAVVGPTIQQTFEQDQSPFVNLPAELRVQIYRECLSNRTIHLHGGFWPGDWRGGRKLTDAMAASRPIMAKRLEAEWGEFKLPCQWNIFHSICSNQERHSPTAEHWHRGSDYWSRHHRLCFYEASQFGRYETMEPYDVRTLGAMPLLLSCRKIYTEVIYILYRENTFSLKTSPSNPTRWQTYLGVTLPSFDPVMLSHILLPRHFELITSLDLFLEPQCRTGVENPEDDVLKCIPLIEREWYNRWWEVLYNMQRLKRLYVGLGMFLLSPVTDAACEAILDPIERMRGRGLHEFHISAPEPAFRIFRRCENPPWTSVSFWHQNWVRLGLFGEGVEWDDSPYKRPDDNGVYFPIWD